MNHHLFTGQCESVGESYVTNTTTANDGEKSKILPTHAGTTPVRRHDVPRTSSKKK